MNRAMNERRDALEKVINNRVVGAEEPGRGGRKNYFMPEGPQFFEIGYLVMNREEIQALESFDTSSSIGWLVDRDQSSVEESFRIIDEVRYATEIDLGNGFTAFRIEY